MSSGLDAIGQLQVDGLAVGQRDPLRTTGGSILKRHGEPVSGVCTLLRGRSTPAEAAATTGASSEQSFENFAEVCAPGLGAEPAAATAAKAKGGRRIAVAVDFATVEPRALVAVRQQVISGGDGGKPVGCLGVILVLVGMKFLRELAIGLFDVGVGRTARHAEH